MFAKVHRGLGYIVYLDFFGYVIRIGTSPFFVFFFIRAMSPQHLKLHGTKGVFDRRWKSLR